MTAVPNYFVSQPLESDHPYVGYVGYVGYVEADGSYTLSTSVVERAGSPRTTLSYVRVPPSVAADVCRRAYGVGRSSAAATKGGSCFGGRP